MKGHGRAMSTVPIEPEAPEPDPEPAPLTDGLHITLWRRHQLFEVRLAGELDAATAPRFVDAMGWVRRRRAGPVVVDLTRLRFIDVAGHRALVAGSTGPDGARDPRILWVLGPAVTRFERLLARTARAN